MQSRVYSRRDESFALLNHPVCFDVVVSDFGRESAVAYVAEAARDERERIQTMLAASGGAYFDEYRRIMFDLIGDLGYFKTSLIRAHQVSGRLTDDVLLGVGGTPISSEIRDRICSTMLVAAWQALCRDGTRRVRLVIPCNTLSSLGSYLRETVADASRLRSLLGQTPGHRGSLSSTVMVLRAAQIDVFTVPSVVLKSLADLTQSRSLLLLGTRTAIEMYEEEAILREDGAVIESLSADDYALVDLAIGASLSRERDALTDLRMQIVRQIIEPRLRNAQGQLTVVEACTDLDMSLGLNSRQVFARCLVDDAYAGLSAIDA